MFRSRVLSLTLHRNIISPQNRIIISISQRPVSNLKEEYFESVIYDSSNKNYELLENGITETLFAIRINHSLLNTCNNTNNNYNFGNNLRFKNSLKQHSSRSTDENLTKLNNFHNTSTLLSPKYSFNKKACINLTGLRHFSTGTAHDIPRPELTGFWKAMSESAPVEFVQENLVAFQSMTNLPWWATVILTTFIVRSTMTLPLSIYQHYILAKVQNLQIEMHDVVKKLKREANIAVSHYGLSENYARMFYEQSLKRKWNELIVKENCHPAKGLIVLWTQMPVWITISAALRNLCYMLPPSHADAEKIYLELTTGGFGWVTNLIDVDHFWIIPVSVGLFNLANIEIMSLTKIKEETKIQKYLLYFFRFISIGMIPIATYVPSCICLYWASSSAFGLIQNLVLLSPKVRRLSGVPITSTERVTPYRDLVKNFKAKRYIHFGRKSTTTLE